MKKNLRNKRVNLRLLALIMLAACSSGDEQTHHADMYNCAIHPKELSDEPGTCLVCGMDLVRKAWAGEQVEMSEDLAKVLKSPNEAIVASVNTIKGQFKSIPVTIKVQGVVTHDTRNTFTIAARGDGRLERVYLKYEFQPVSQGQEIARIYSPELITVQRELIFLLENDPANKSLIDAAQSKLKLLGMTNGQIIDLSRNREAGNTISVYSPYSGYIITAQQAPSASVAIPSRQQSGWSMSDGMGASRSFRSMAARQTQGSRSTARTTIREGNYVSTGETLFTVVDANSLRIELNLPGIHTGAVAKGSIVELDLGNGKRQVATVDFIQPFFAEGQEFVKIRVYTNKTESLHIGHLVNATINLESSESLWIPKEAVIDLGDEKVVFLKERGVFKPKVVKTGINTDGMIEIKDGLASSQEIAVNAQYLVDSESFIKPVK